MLSQLGISISRHKEYTSIYIIILISSLLITLLLQLLTKCLNGAIRTKTFIRNIPEPIEFVISATVSLETLLTGKALVPKAKKEPFVNVKVEIKYMIINLVKMKILTNDPSRTTYAKVRIISDGEFNLPEDLIFTKSYYMASYTKNNEIELEEPITLLQGYDDQVSFTLETTDEYSQYFSIVVTEANNILIQVDSPISLVSMIQRKIFLVIKAQREYTAGAFVTVIVQLPEEVNLKFENPNYLGSIVDNVLLLSKLVLSQGYEGHTVSIDIQNEYASFFSHNIQNENEIELKMNPLSSTVIEENNVLNLQVIASTTRSSATSIVTLEIVKDDNVTPVFGETMYLGSYNPVDGLELKEITLAQGYDETVEVLLYGG
ncbi:hypothetical protein ACJJTC_015752 [Scirpophaga incertulas]